MFYCPPRVQLYTEKGEPYLHGSESLRTTGQASEDGKFAWQRSVHCC